MAQTLEQLTQQEQTLSSIRGIVRTMKALAAVNAAPYEQAALAVQACRQTIRNGFAAFVWRMGNRWLAELPPPGQQILVAFGSDHGFCGNYNAAMAQAVHGVLARPCAPAPFIICIGAKLQGALADIGIEVGHRLTPPASADGIGRLASEVVTQIERCGRGAPLARLAVQLAHTRSTGPAGRTASVIQLLPLERSLLESPRRWPQRSLPDFSMEPAALLAALLRNHLFASVFHAAAEAMVTENAARLALMQQAEQSVDERLDTVRRQLSGVRQDQITEELMDIVVGHMQ